MIDMEAPCRHLHKFSCIVYFGDMFTTFLTFEIVAHYDCDLHIKRNKSAKIPIICRTVFRIRELFLAVSDSLMLRPIRKAPIYFFSRPCCVKPNLIHADQFNKPINKVIDRYNGKLSRIKPGNHNLRICIKAAIIICISYEPFIEVLSKE